MPTTKPCPSKISCFSVKLEFEDFSALLHLFSQTFETVLNWQVRRTEISQQFYSSGLCMETSRKQGANKRRKITLSAENCVKFRPCLKTCVFVLIHPSLLFLFTGNCMLAPQNNNVCSRGAVTSDNRPLVQTLSEMYIGKCL